MSPDISVVIGSLNGSAGVRRCLHALSEQTIRSSIEVIVVDDGSADDTSDVARGHGASIVRHATNRGVSAARNSGVAVASAPIVAFLDDDCEPERQWAEQVLAAHGEQVVAVGGPLLVSCGPGVMSGFLRRNNPLEPLELELARSDSLPYRLFLYLRRQWRRPEPRGRRAVFSVASANLSVRRQAFLEVGGFDESFRFGSEDEDLCKRLLLAFPSERLLFVPEARVIHHFGSTVRETLKRRLAYGRGSARLYRKWPGVLPKVFPGPVLVLVALVLAARFPALAAVALVLPGALYPRSVRTAIVERDPRCLLDAYLLLSQESCDDLGFLQGLWRVRRLAPEPGTELTRGPRGGLPGPERTR